MCSALGRCVRAHSAIFSPFSDTRDHDVCADADAATDRTHSLFKITKGKFVNNNMVENVIGLFDIKYIQSNLPDAAGCTYSIVENWCAHCSRDTRFSVSSIASHTDWMHLRIHECVRSRVLCFVCFFFFHFSFFFASLFFPLLFVHFVWFHDRRELVRIMQNECCTCTHPIPAQKTSSCH